ncbi:MAG TPA: lipid-binding protein, partial [Cyclobacteriaceae bacterium]|nr:lipid-binding protein [Cyclobacteriaceae bacterium]
MNPSIRRNAIAALVALTLLWSCTETEFDKVLLPTTEVAGEYVVTLELEALDITDEQHIRLFNTAAGGDSLWLEDLNFFESQVKVALNDDNTFGI